MNNKKLNLIFMFSLAFLELNSPLSANSLNLPKNPSNKTTRFIVGTVEIIASTLIGYHAGGRIENNLAAKKFGFFTGLIIGLIGSYDYWISHSPAGCVHRFNEEYNKFLLSPVLKSNTHESMWIPGYFNNDNRWPLVEARSLLLEHQINLNKVIDFGRVLINSEAVQALGDDACCAIARKNDVMILMLDLIKERVAFIQQSPMYSMQNELKKQFERMQKNSAAEREFLNTRDELARLRDHERQNFVNHTPQAYPTAPVYNNVPFQNYVRQCGLCAGNLIDNKGYATKCACSPGNHTYHYECIKTHFNSSHDCPKCHTENPELHSDFGDNFVATATQPAPLPTFPAPTAAPAPSRVDTCTLCSGHIQANKRYRTDCNCTAGRYYYHHECVAGTLKQNGSRCPKCNKAETTVRSAF